MRGSRVVVALLSALALGTASALVVPDARGGGAPVVEPTSHSVAEAAVAGRQAGAQQANVVPRRQLTTATAATGGSFVTYRVFATQYAPSTAGSVEVAVPDKCVKFAARGDTTTLRNFGCSYGYATNLDYRVNVVRDNGQSAAIRVGDVGPWNIDDNYWDPPLGPRPRRMFNDLPQGTPESQAARYQSYNYSPNCKDLNNNPTGHGGGADQYGRCVTNPSALDLSVAAASQLGLGSGQNEWVTVSYLWEPVTGPTWQPWVSIGSPPGGLTSGPDTAAWAPGRFDVFARGGDNALWHAWFDGSWHGWESLGGGLGGDPGVASWSAGRLDVVVRGTDNNLWHKWFDGGWHPWEYLGAPAGGLTSGPDAVSWSAGRLDVFGRGGDNSLVHKWYAGGWSGWESLGGVLAADPGVASWGSGRLDVVVRGTDNNLWHKWYAGGWSGWEGLGAPFGGLTSGPDAASWGPGRLDVFARANDNSLIHKWYAGGWQGWETLGGTLLSDPGVAAPSSSRLGVFVKGSDGSAWYRLFA